MLTALGGASAPGRVDITLDGLRSGKGNVLVCMTADASRFPKCQNDPAARRLVVPAAQARSFEFEGVPSGDYAIALVHDENGNRRLDTAARIPTEGVGFSRNPRLFFGPPSFRSAEFDVHGGAVREQVKLKYFL